MEKVFQMELRKVYPLLVAKAERKGRSRAEVDEVTGSICGVKVEAIQDPLLRDIRVLDKLVDELAKGKPLEKVLRK